MKIDLYTKIVLTILTVFVGILVFRDVDFVTKAQANELDLSALKIEDASSAGATTFYIYENDKLVGGFGKETYKRCDYYGDAPRVVIKSSSDKQAYINPYLDVPKYIITTKTGSFRLER